jgi:hypothetical protein
MTLHEDLKGSDVHRFTHFDYDSEVELMELEESQRIEDSLNSNQQPDEGYVNMPERLPLGLFLGVIIQFVVLVVGGTAMFTSMKAEQASVKEQVSRIEENMYTKQEALLRLEMQRSELDNLKQSLIERKGKTNETDR